MESALVFVAKDDFGLRLFELWCAFKQLRHLEVNVILFQVFTEIVIDNVVI